MCEQRRNMIMETRSERVRSAQSLIRKAAGLLSDQRNDEEEMIGGALSGIVGAEDACREALRSLSGLAR